jgi:hypothetical protein
MSALESFPRELSLGQRRGEWVLAIHGPGVSGEAVSSSRAVVEAIAEAYAAALHPEVAGG